MRQQIHVVVVLRLAQDDGFHDLSVPTVSS
jgi:hypothetical protein